MQNEINAPDFSTETNPFGFTDQLISFQILSVKHSLLPGDYKVEIQFFVVLQSSQGFSQLHPIVYPFTTDINNNDPDNAITIDIPYEIMDELVPGVTGFLVAKARFFLPSDALMPSVDDHDRSMQETAEQKTNFQCKYNTRKLRRDPTNANDVIMIGARKIIAAKSANLSLVLIEPDKHGLDFSSDGNIVPRIIKISNKAFNTPFILMACELTKFDDTEIDEE